MTPNPFTKQYLMTAGPTPIPPAVSQAMAAPMLYHRAPAFDELYERVLSALPAVFRTENDVLAFASSGSGAMESAVANLVRPGDKVLACAAGKFGERWIQLCEAYGADVVRYEPGWGERLDSAEIDRLLTDDVKVAFATLSETSTGIVHDVQAIAEVAKAHGVILAVDAVSGLGAAELRQDEWGIDVVVAGSQKALMCAPGLAFASVSPKALEYADSRPGGRYYFDWGRTAKSQRKGASPFTPAVSLFLGLDVALQMIEQEGLDDVMARHRLLARATRAGAAAIGLELFGDPDERSTVVTAVELPEDIDGGKVPGALRRLGITANGGQDHLKGRIVRIAHCGYFGAFDIVTSLSGLEMVLQQLGREVDHGAGPGAAQRVFLEAGVRAAASKVLVAEKIAAAGVDMLRERFDVDLGVDWSADELADRIGGYDAILIRSATKLTADLIDRADRLKVIGRAGVGVDNVDVGAATRRGIIVANAPASNVITAAEHTVALLLALARNVPQAHKALTGGSWERSKWGGVEVYEKTLGLLGFGRIGQLVGQRAQGFGMHVVAFDPFVSAARFRELGVEQATSSDDLYAQSDFISIHLPKTPETAGWLNAEALAKCRDGVRIVNCARGELVDDEALKDALDSGKVAGAALDVFVREPVTDHPLFGYPNVVVTPHLAASTTEAQDRAGVQTAEQVVAALTGGVVSTAVNIPAVSAEDMEVLGPFLPLASGLGRVAMALAESTNLDRVELEYLGRIAERDTRLLTLSVLNGLLAGHTDEEVNLVNAPSLAEQRGIQISERKEQIARDFTDLVRVTVIAGGARTRVVGTTLGNQHRPHLLEAWGQRFNLQMDEGHLALFHYQDVPGMVGRVGTVFGQHGVNISAAAVGREPPGYDGEDAGDLAVMAVTTDGPIPSELIDEIVALEGFIGGRSVPLAG